MPDFPCKRLGKAAGSCLSAMSTLDISLIILVLEVVGWGPRMETWHLPKSWRQWKLFLLPQMRNWLYLLALVHKGGLVAGNHWPGNRLCSPWGAGRSSRVYAQQWVLCFCYCLLSTDTQGAVYATFSVRGKPSEAAQSACAHRCYCAGQNRGHAEEMLPW